MRPGALTIAALLATATCARSWSGPISFEPGSPLECPATAATESCFPARPVATPVIVAPGRILVLTEGGLSPHPDLIRAGMPGFPFMVDEITLDGHVAVAQGYCPKPSEAGGLGQLASGEIAVVCLDHKQSHLGIVDRARRTVSWRWQMPIGYVPPPPDIHIVELGGRIGVVYSEFVDMHVPKNWNLVLGPEGHGISLDDGLDEIVERRIVALVSVDDGLHVLFAGGSPELGLVEVVLSPNGTKSVRKAAAIGRFVAGEAAAECVSQDAAGTVTVTWPATRYDDGPGGNPVARPGTLTIRYPRARLSRGADAYPSPDGRCVGRRAASHDPSRPETDWWRAHDVRATRVGRRELVVYDTPPDEMWNATVRVERRN